MKMLQILVALLILTATPHAEFALGADAKSSAMPDGQKTIEGYWQDTARRILFARDAPPAYAYGNWTSLDPGQTYPTAKQIRRSGAGFELVDLLYDDEHAISIVKATNQSIEFVRSTKFPACAMHHLCRLEGNNDELFCSLEDVCREGGRDVLVWKGEERYARRAHCERDGRRQAQGIPHRCR